MDMRRKLETNSLVPYLVGDYFGSHSLDHTIIPQELKPPFYKANEYSFSSQHSWDNVKGILLNPKFAPLMAQDYSRLPQTFIYVARSDVVRDDALFYQEQLLRAGVRVECIMDNNGYHGSFWDTNNLYVFDKVTAFLNSSG